MKLVTIYGIIWLDYYCISGEQFINPRPSARMHSEGYCTWFVSVCLMPYFSDTVSLHVERKVPMASPRHCADYYKKGFCNRRFIQKLCLTRDILRGYCSVIPRTFSTAEPSKGPKKANNRLNATWNTTLRKAASFFLLHALVSVLSSVYFPLHVIISLARALSRIRVCALYAVTLSLWQELMAPEGFAL